MEEEQRGRVLDRKREEMGREEGRGSLLVCKKMKKKCCLNLKKQLKTLSPIRPDTSRGKCILKTWLATKKSEENTDDDFPTGVLSSQPCSLQNVLPALLSSSSPLRNSTRRALAKPFKAKIHYLMFKILTEVESLLLVSRHTLILSLGYSRPSA